MIKNKKQALQYIAGLEDGKHAVHFEEKAVSFLRKAAWEYSAKCQERGQGWPVVIESDVGGVNIIVNPHERPEVVATAAQNEIVKQMLALQPGQSFELECEPKRIEYVRYVAYTQLGGFSVTPTATGCTVTRRESEKSDREIVFEMLDGFSGAVLQVENVSVTKLRSYVSQYNAKNQTDFGVRRTDQGCEVYVSGNIPAALRELYTVVRDRVRVSESKAVGLREYVLGLLAALDKLTDPTQQTDAAQ